MDAPLSSRIRGNVKLISRQGKTFGIIVGDDLRDYMFLPSYMEIPEQFLYLNPLTPVEFSPWHHGVGKLRAWNVSVLPSTEIPDGESLQSRN